MTKYLLIFVYKILTFDKIYNYYKLQNFKRRRRFLDDVNYYFEELYEVNSYSVHPQSIIIFLH